jgi:hypothetical protein
VNPKRIGILLIFLISCGIAEALSSDANDFAKEWLSYSAGLGAGNYKIPGAALGRPRVDTDYLGALRPVVPVYPQWLPNDVVTVGVGGHLTLKFNHKVADDENNPYGFDFIIFGNSMMALNGGNNWQYGNPQAAILLNGQVNSEFGRVYVSQYNNEDWYEFEQGPYADTFAPTLSRVYDPNEPNQSYAGWNNLWWGQETDPTLPLDPNVKGVDFAGRSLAELCLAYGKSAGGTGFDLKFLSAEDYNALETDPQTGRKWIQYIRIECTATNPSQGPLPEIDAVSDVSCCGDYKRPSPASDLNKDCRVDSEDLMIMTGYWLCEADEESEAAAADIYRDGFIDFLDFSVLANSWLKDSLQNY